MSDPAPLFPHYSDYTYDKYQWCTRGENCPLCDAMEGRVYEMNVYIDTTVAPGFHPGCNCYLKKVSSDTPTSDMDIFGSYRPTLPWYMFLFGDNDGGVPWTPYSWDLLGAMDKFHTPGTTFKQAFEAYKAEINDFGIFSNNQNQFNIQFLDISLNVFKTGTPDIFQTLAGTITSLVGTNPHPERLKPTLPEITYHNTLYNLGISR